MAATREQVNEVSRAQQRVIIPELRFSWGYIDPHIELDMSVRTRTGFYRQEVNKTAWEVPERYRELKQVGTGAYGTVW